MSPAFAAALEGDRLHLHHGPIDLLVKVEGKGACGARARAMGRFATVLDELVAELALLRREVDAGAVPQGRIARRMHKAVLAHKDQAFITPMAAVAGAVADEILAVIRSVPGIDRAFVNNGGDIAFDLLPGSMTRFAIAGLDGRRKGEIALRSEDGIGGIATSGCGGRSLSLGIADQVSVLARDAASADAAATLIANAVDLPGHPAVRREPACDLDPDSDLGSRLVVTGCGPLSGGAIARALAGGRAVAQAMVDRGLIRAAILFLRGRVELAGCTGLSLVLDRPLPIKGLPAARSAMRMEVR